MRSIVLSPEGTYWFPRGLPSQGYGGQAVLNDDRFQLLSKNICSHIVTCNKVVIGGKVVG